MDPKMSCLRQFSCYIYYSYYIIPLETSKEGTDIALLSVGVTDTGQDEKSVVPAGRLVNLYAESKEFLSVKQHLEQRLEVALNEPVGMTPQFATNFLWQVNLHVCVHVKFVVTHTHKHTHTHTHTRTDMHVHTHA